MLRDIGHSADESATGRDAVGGRGARPATRIWAASAGQAGRFHVIEGNPLADIGATKNVRMVIKDGEVMDTEVRPEVGQPDPARGRRRTLARRHNLNWPDTDQ